MVRIHYRVPLVIFHDVVYHYIMKRLYDFFRNFNENRFLRSEPRYVLSYLDESEVHGDSLGRIDDLRGSLESLARNTKNMVTANRLYVDAASVSINFSINDKKYLIVSGERGLELAVTKSNGSTKYPITFEELESGSFLTPIK